MHMCTYVHMYMCTHVYTHHSEANAREDCSDVSQFLSVTCGLPWGIIGSRRVLKAPGGLWDQFPPNIMYNAVHAVDLCFQHKNFND